ncbi:MAG TPA: hypothetical protein PK719_04950 [Bacteroidales bacterium]|nr:hypothetical protein [Bacteroidales bacterium]
MIKQSHYKNKKSIVLENKYIRAEFIPNPGGKLSSLINKKTGFEYLVQRGNTIYCDQPFDGVYVKGECSGYDDMFPTIDTCFYENEPWKGVKMADHGEVWSLPWEYKIEKNSLCLSVSGVRFPYSLTKKIHFSSHNRLRIDYSLVNNSPFDFEFLWAGHMMFNVEEGTKIEVPTDCKQTITIFSNRGRKFGDLNDWPYFRNTDGTSYKADVARPKEIMGKEKFYFTNKLKNGWCKLVYPNKKELKVFFTAKTVPYLGIFINEGGWDDLYNIFIEPCTVAYDRPDLAKKFGQISKVGPSGKYTWYIDIMI